MQHPSFLSRGVRFILAPVVAVYLCILLYNGITKPASRDLDSVPNYVPHNGRINLEKVKSFPSAESPGIKDASLPMLSVMENHGIISTHNDSLHVSHGYNKTPTQNRILKRHIAMKDYMNIPELPYLDHFKNPCFKVYEHENSSKVEIKCMPYFMIGGFPKTGTTDLYHRMNRHPQIMGPAKGKEPLWWSICRYAPARSPLASYLRDIGKAGSIIKTGNASWHPGIVGDYSTREMLMERNQWVDGATTPHMIRHLAPRMRFIVLMREPAARLYSDYVYFSKKYIPKVSPDNFHIAVTRAVNWWRNCIVSNSIRNCMFGPGPADMPNVFTGAPFHACWKPFVPGHICGYFKVGLYYHILKEWLDVFPRDQFLFLRSEDFAKNPAHVIHTKVLPFLNISQKSVREQTFQAGTGSGNRVKATLKQQGRYKPMLNSTLNLLYDLYREPTRKLAELLNDDAYLWRDLTNAYV